MATKLPSSTLRRASIPSNTKCQCIHQPQKRNATFLQRPHRPYTFTQLVTLSDGSTYMHRTTSPLPIFRSTKDTRNNPLWQPSMAALRNVEADEAGRLRAFRNKFGRGWDAEAADEEDPSSSASDSNTASGALAGGKRLEEEDSLMDLISSQYGSRESNALKDKNQDLNKAAKAGDDGKKMITIKNRETGKLEKVEVTGSKADKVDKKEKKAGDGNRGWGGSS